MPASAASCRRSAQAALDLLDPQPGEHDPRRRLRRRDADAARSSKRGATLSGSTTSLSMVGAAKAQGLDARLMDAAQLKFGEAFDAAFSNADAALGARQGARGAGDLVRAEARRPLRRRDGRRGQSRQAARGARRRTGRARLSGRRPTPPTGIPTSRNSPRSTSTPGSSDIDARLIERPTPLEHGVAAWVTTFRAGWLDRAGVPARRAPSHRRRRRRPRRHQHRRLCPPPLHHEEAQLMRYLPLTDADRSAMLEDDRRRLDRRSVPRRARGGAARRADPRPADACQRDGGRARS